jgi:hypothetical protein
MRRDIEILINSDEIEIFQELEAEKKLKIAGEKRFTKNRLILQLEIYDRELSEELKDYRTFKTIYYESNFYRVGTSFIIFTWTYMLYETVFSKFL